MKKFFVKAAALLSAAVFVFTGNVAYASEDTSGGEPLVIDIPDAYFKIEIPDRYEIVVDQNKEYRGNLADYGLDAADTMNTMSLLNTRFDAIYVPGDYAIEAFCTYNPATDNTIIKDLSSYSDEEIKEFCEDVASSASIEDNGIGVTSYQDGLYRDKNGIAYGCIKMDYTTKDADGSTTIGAYCLWTIVDGRTYYFYTKGYEPDIDGSVYRDETLELVEGVTFYNTPDLSAYKDTDETISEIQEKLNSSNEDISELIDKINESDISTGTADTVQEEPAEEDVDDLIENFYFQAGRVFAIVVVIMIIIGVIVAIISSNNAKKKRYQQQQYYYQQQQYYNQQQQYYNQQQQYYNQQQQQQYYNNGQNNGNNNGNNNN